MSRWIESGEDEHGRFYIEMLADPDGCKWLISEVCCNVENREMVCDFPLEEDCNKSCSYFEAEPADEIDVLREGKITYEGTGKCNAERGSDE